MTTWLQEGLQDTNRRFLVLSFGSQVTVPVKAAHFVIRPLVSSIVFVLL